MLHTLKPATGATHRRKRIARGNSGQGGTTGGRGTKGQHARTGKGRRLGFEGGQVPLIRRQPKLGGFTPPRQKTYEVVNLETLELRLAAGSYTLDDLKKQGIIHGKRLVKILGQGTLTKKLTLQAHRVSKSAKAAVTKAGGTITLVK